MDQISCSPFTMMSAVLVCICIVSIAAVVYLIAEVRDINRRWWRARVYAELLEGDLKNRECVYCGQADGMHPCRD